MKKNDKSDVVNLYVIYRNYLYALQEREEYGNKYGDTEEIIQIYEDVLKKNNVKTLMKKSYKK